MARPKLTAPEECPVCGEEVPRSSLACQSCGADHNSGWRIDADIRDGLDLPGEDDFNYDEFTRRELMMKMAKTAFGITLAPMFGRSIATAADFVPLRARAAKSVIFLMMEGGMSHLDTWDVKPGNDKVMGKTGIIDTSVPGLKLSENLVGHQNRATSAKDIRSAALTESLR